MKKVILIFYLLLLPGMLIAQQGFDRLQANMPPIDRFSPRHVDFSYTNSTGKKTYVLRVNAGPQLSYLMSSRELLPDSTVKIRIQYNPLQKGSFHETIEVFLAHLNDPVILGIRGIVEEIPTDLNVPCPSFSQTSFLASNREFRVNVLDSISGEPVRKANIHVVQGGKVIATYRTNQKGQADVSVPPGYLFIPVSAAGYFEKGYAGYIPANQSEMTFLLARPTEHVHVEPDTPDSDTTELVDWQMEPELPNDTAEFSEQHYAPNNIVFLLDISSSMGKKGRLEMLKFSMMELMRMLRSVDRVTIVTYASWAEVLQPAVSGSNKEELERMISELQAFGNTAGGDGIKLAYEQAKASRIPNGNNIVIMVTDGAFNTGDKKYMKEVRKNAKKGTIMSVVAVKSTDYARESLIDVADAGKGRMIVMYDLEDAMTVLKEEIKKGSFIKNP